MTVETANPYGPFIASGLDIMRAKTAEANGYADKLKVFGDTGALVHEIRDSEDLDSLPESIRQAVAEYRQFADEVNNRLLAAQAKTEAIIKEHDPRFDSSNTEDEETLKASHKAAADEVRNLMKTLQSLGAEIPEDMPELTKVKGSRVSTSTGTGTRRLRLSKITVDGQNVEDSKGNVTNGVLAKYLNDSFDDIDVEVSTLTNLTLEAAGTDDISTVAGDIEYDYRGHKIVVTPKR